MKHMPGRPIFIFLLQTKPLWPALFISSFPMVVKDFFQWWLKQSKIIFHSKGEWNCTLNILRPRQNGRHFADDIFKWIFLNENVWVPTEISLKFVPHGPINNIAALVQIMAWRQPGDKPLSGPMIVRLPTHICVTRPQWVKQMYFRKW